MKQRRKASGRSAQPPSRRLSLGKFVSVRARGDGTFRVLFEIPPRLRPSGWSPTIPLPRQAPRTGALDNADELARIRTDAAALYEDYLRAKGLKPQGARGHSVETLIATWKASQAWKDNRPRTNQGYDQLLRYIRGWSEGLGHPDPRTLTPADIETFLALFDDRPTLKYHLRKVLRMVMKQMRALGWRQDNPVEDVVVKMPKTRVVIWEQEDVDLYAWAACCARQPALAALILTEWEIGQRLTDAILFRHGAEYVDGVFTFSQSKTAEPVTIPVSDRLRAVLEAVRRPDSPYLFYDGGTDRPFRDMGRLSHVFETVRDVALSISGPDGKLIGRYLVLRALRHSCVVMLARASCEIPEIVAVTGHRMASASAILDTYLPRDSKVAGAAQRKRGLLRNEN